MFKKDVIKESLSLSKSGGIYFAGERVPADENQMVLFVGLGGTGANALIRMKHQIYNRMKLPVDPQTGIPTADHPANMAFLALDTDLDIETLTYGNTGFAKNGSEVFNIGVEKMQAVLDTMAINRENEMPYAMWYPNNNKIAAINGTYGAGGKRPVGRAAFFNRYSDIRSRVEQILDRLKTDSPRAQSLEIFLFTGIAGGTGSGIYLDVAYMLRELGNLICAPAQVFGYIFLPDVISNDAHLSYLSSNGFSALKELDYFMEHGKESTHFFEQPYTATLTGTGSVPMDYCHLISATDIHGHQYSKNDIMKSVVESVFFHISSSEYSIFPTAYCNAINNLFPICRKKLYIQLHISIFLLALLLYESHIWKSRLCLLQECLAKWKIQCFLIQSQRNLCRMI